MDSIDYCGNECFLFAIIDQDSGVLMLRDEEKKKIVMMYVGEGATSKIGYVI